MHPTLQKLIDAKVPMELKPPASPKAISQFEREQGIELPEHYWEFLQFGNGGHFFGHNFYGIDPENENYYLAKENASKPYSIPADWYIIGATGYGDLYCIDPATNEVVQWDHEKDEASLRWATMFELVEDAYQGYEKNKQYDYEHDEDEEAEEDIPVVKELFYADGMGVFVKLEKGIFAGQMIYMYSWTKDGIIKISIGTAQQLSPFPFDAIPPYKDWKILRDVPFKERVTLRYALEIYCEANPGKFEL